jgi:hypothetical protein
MILLSYRLDTFKERFKNRTTYLMIYTYSSSQENTMGATCGAGTAAFY